MRPSAAKAGPVYNHPRTGWSPYPSRTRVFPQPARGHISPNQPNSDRWCPNLAWSITLR